jgi:hypothetical protein
LEIGTKCSILFTDETEKGRDRAGKKKGREKWGLMYVKYKIKTKITDIFFSYPLMQYYKGKRT